MIRVRFMSVKGKFRVLKTLDFDNLRQARYDIVEFYSPLGFSNFNLIDTDPGEGGRFTATTPGGRAGRNVAFYEYL